MCYTRTVVAVRVVDPWKTSWRSSAVLEGMRAKINLTVRRRRRRRRWAPGRNRKQHCRHSHAAVIKTLCCAHPVYRFHPDGDARIYRAFGINTPSPPPIYDPVHRYTRQPVVLTDIILYRGICTYRTDGSIVLHVVPRSGIR